MATETWTYTFADGEYHEAGHLSDGDSVASDLRDWILGGDWGEIESTIWISACAYIDGDEDDVTHVTVAIDPEEPPCAGAGEHVWRAPHAIVGGIEESPGVWGHGGGVTCTSVCIVCGCAMDTDSWAQNPETGEQGLDSVEYTAGKYADEIIPPAVRTAKKELDAAGSGVEGETLEAAAYILLAVRGDYEEPAESALSTLCAEGRARVTEAGEYLDRVWARTDRTKRALRLAMHLAAQDDQEREIAGLVSRVIGVSS